MRKSGEVPMTKLDAACRASGDAATSGVLSIPPRIYREYAAELRELARTATNGSRELYLKMANTWTYAAVRFEAGVVELERDTTQGVNGSHNIATA
jgi:hypothetical protein